MSKLQRNQNT